MILDRMKERPILKHQEEFDAYYNPVLDQIILPQFKVFNDPETYYLLLFHNLIHWTGNIKRLARLGLWIVHWEIKRSTLKKALLQN